MATKKTDWADAAVLSQLPAAKVRGQRRMVREPKAIAARFDVSQKRVCVELSNGVSMSFPPQLAQALKGVSPKALAQIEISPMGTGLHWPALDADLSIAGMLKGAFGSRFWMRDLAAKAGSTRSEAKTAAARLNGVKGGRPKKTTV